MTAIWPPKRKGITSGLQSLVLGNTPYFDVITGLSTSPTRPDLLSDTATSVSLNSAAIGPEVEGDVGYLYGASDPRITIELPSLSTRSFTFASRLKVYGSSGAGVGGRGDDTGNILLWRASSQWDMRIGGTNYTQAGTFSSGQYYDYVLTCDASSAKIWIDGSLVINGGTPGASTLKSVNIGTDTAGGGSIILEFAYFAFWDRPILPEEVAQLRHRPRRLLQPANRVIFLPAGGTTITASGAVQALSTYKSQVSLSADIAGSLHTSAASSHQSQVYLNKVIGADVQGITLSVSNASLSSDREILAAGQQISLQSFEAGISLSGSVSAALYSAELVTRQAGVSLDTSIAAQLAQVALLASVATVSQGVQSGIHGSELSANRATVSLDIQVAGTLENVGLTALAASVGLGRNIDAFIQNISLTPRGVELVFDSAISASTESVELATFRATLANSEAALLVPGLEYTIPDNVGHFTVPVSKTGYTIPINRIHFTFLDED